MFRVDGLRSEPRVLHELTQNKIAEDTESDIAILFVDENDCREISVKALSAKRKLKNSRAGKSLKRAKYSLRTAEDHL